MSQMFGPYQLLAPLATGGMGQLYLARSSGPEGFQKLLVVKMLLAHHSADPGFISMFLDEARLAAKLNHPNVCQIFDLGEVNGTYYLAMEYLPGADLRALEKDCQEQGRPLPLPLACRIIAGAAAGLHYAHELSDDAGRHLGLVHRDVSPSNVVVSFDGGVKLIDFGIAKAAGKSANTATGQLKGKFAYMSPEQAEGEPLDGRSDLYSLGLVFHELITGKRVLQRDSDTQTLKAARDPNIELPSRLNPALPPSIDPVLMRAVARVKEERYATGQEMTLALEDWLLESQQPASQAHLAAFLRELYPDYLQRSRGPAAGAGEDSLGRTFVRTPSSAPAPAPAPTPALPAPASQTTGVPQQGWWKLLIAASVVLSLAAAAFAVLKDKGPPPPLPSTAALPVPAKAVPPVAPQPPVEPVLPAILPLPAVEPDAGPPPAPPRLPKVSEKPREDDPFKTKGSR